MNTIFIIFNLIVLESMLSVDNSVILAIMVKDLPYKQKSQALRYGLLGAYIFRGTCLFLASWLINIFWLKIVGGAYLLYLVYGHFTPKNDTIEEVSNVNDSKIFKLIQRIGISKFWSTVVLVEIMDVCFGLDNIFAAVALSNKFWVVMTGVAIGILAMRFVAAWFVKLIEKYPSLETSAFIVIFILGIKLIIAGIADYSIPFAFLKEALASHLFDLIFSGCMMIIFFIPLLINKKIKRESTYPIVNEFMGCEFVDYDHHD